MWHGSSGPTSPPTGAPTGSSGSIVYGQFADAKILNPILASDGSSQLVWENIFESLVKIDPQTGSPIPGLAWAWEESPDSLTYMFHLRSGITWSDGQPFTADDVKFTFDTIQDARAQSPFRSQYNLVKAHEAVDPLTFRVTLAEPLCSFLTANMTQAIVPKHVLANVQDINTDAFNSSRPIGTGPYVLKEWKKRRPRDTGCKRELLARTTEDSAVVAARRQGCSSGGRSFARHWLPAWTATSSCNRCSTARAR